MSFTGEEDYDRFLESIGLSLQDLKPYKTIEMPEQNVRLTYFEHVKGIVIAKNERIQENVTACYYSVTPPGFTQQEILDYNNKTIMNKSFSSQVRFYHSHHFLNMFGHIKFRRAELKTAFSRLKKNF